MVRIGPVIAMVAQLALLAALAGTVGLGALGWFVGVAYGLVMNSLLTMGLARAGAQALGPANAVTLTRATLVGGVAALVVDSFFRDVPAWVIVVIAAVALCLDGVDGKVARRTRTATSAGARFDQEIDASLILVLSVHVADSVGAWVLLIGAARYLYLAAGWPLSWLREPPPQRYWVKVVAAIQGIVLTAVVSNVLPMTVNVAVTAVALVLLTVSFAHSVWWLWRGHRAERRRAGRGPAALVPMLSRPYQGAGPLVRTPRHWYQCSRPHSHH